MGKGVKHVAHDLGDKLQKLVTDQEQHHVVHELAGKKAQLRSVWLETPERVLVDKAGDAVQQTAQGGDAVAHAAAQWRSPSHLRGAQARTTGHAGEAGAGDDNGLNAEQSIRDAEQDVSSIEYENLRLHNMLAVAYSNGETLEAQANKLPLLQHTITSEQKRRRELKMQLYNAKRSIAKYKGDLDQVRQRAGSLQSNNSGLSGALRNMTHARQALYVGLLISGDKKKQVEVALGTTKAQLNKSGGTLRAFEELRQSLKKVAERTVEEEGRSKREKAATQSASHSIAQLQQNLNASERNVVEEVAREGKLNKTSKYLVGQLQVERDAVSKDTARSKQLTIANQRLAKEAAFLEHRLADGDRARKHAQHVAAETQHSLVRTEAEVKQLNGSVPWLRDKVAADERDLKKAVSETRAAYEARDVATAMMDQAKEKIVALERQYASVVQNIAQEDATAATRSYDTDSTVAVTAAPPPPNLDEVASWTSPDEDSELEEQMAEGEEGDIR